MKNLRLIASLMILGLSLGCGPKGSNGNPVSPPPAGGVVSESDAFIQGAVYSSSCNPSKSEYAGLRFPNSSASFTMSDSKFMREQFFFTDDCKTQSLIVRDTGTVNIMGPPSEIQNPLAAEFILEHTTVTAVNGLVVAAFNIDSTCGFNDWAINTEKEIGDPEGREACPAKLNPRTETKLIVVEHGALFFGDNRTLAFTKQ